MHLKVFTSRSYDHTQYKAGIKDEETPNRDKYQLTVYCRRLRKKDFTAKTESASRKRTGKREYLNDSQTRQLMKQLNAFFEGMVEIPRIRIGGRQTIETLINEEALLLAKYLRDERDNWTPRIASAGLSIKQKVNN